MSNRIIKEQVIESESLAAVSAEAERVYWRLVVMVDDWGWMAADPVVLLSRALPRLVNKVTLAQFEAWVDELLAGGHPMAELWLFKGKPFLRLTGAAERNGQPIHFTVRAHKSKHPVAVAIAEAARVRTCAQLHAAASTCEQPQAPASGGEPLPPPAARNENGNENGNEGTKEKPAGAGSSGPQGGSAERPTETEPAPGDLPAEPVPSESGELVLDGGGLGSPKPKARRQRFEAWWTVYRARTGRGTDKDETWQAFQRLTDAEQADLLPRTLAWFKKRDLLRDAQAFVPEAPDPKRFIRKRRWRDELSVPAGGTGETATGRRDATGAPLPVHDRDAEDTIETDDVGVERHVRIFRSTATGEVIEKRWGRPVHEKGEGDGHTGCDHTAPH